MIPHAINRAVEASLPNAVHNAQIAVNGMAFRTLSGNLYTDRILAIVRELSCNAWDAHAAVNKTDTPFEVFLPSAINPELRVRDFGPGIPKDELPVIYTTFFQSTKLDTNDQIGGFGLGSKSPLSYTDAFSVISYQAGVKCTYAVFLQKDGAPGVTLLSEVNTTEPNGLEVTMPVQPRHISEFTDRAERALRHFPTTPRVLGAKIEPRTYKTRSTLFGIYDCNRRNSATNIVMGHVAYPVNADALDSRTMQTFSPLLHNSNIDIFVPIGSLEIQPSREQLSYDEDTKNKIHDLLNQVMDELTATVQANISKAKTFPDAINTYAEARNNLAWQLLKDRKFTWQNRKISSSSVRVKGPKSSLAQLTNTQWTMTSLRVRFEAEISVAGPKTLVVVWDDTNGMGYLKKLRHNEVLLGNNVLIVRGDKTVLRSTLKQLGMQRFVALSALPTPPKTSAVSVAKNTNFSTVSRGGKLQGKTYSRGVTAQRLDELESEGSLVWVGVNSTHPRDHDGVGGKEILEAINAVDSLRPKDVTVVAIPRGAKKLEKVLCSHVLPYLHAQLDRFEIEHDVAELRTQADKAAFRLPDAHNLLKLTKEYRHKHPNSLLSALARAYTAVEQPNKSYGVTYYVEACKLLGRTPIAAAPTPLRADLKKLYEAIQKQYPLLVSMADRFWGHAERLRTPTTQYLEALDNEHTFLHTQRTLAHDLLRGRPKKREQRAPQVERHHRRTSRRTLRGNPGVNRHDRRTGYVHQR
jgi:hypothetical protein